MIKKYSEKHVRNKFTIISFVCSILVIFIHTYNLDVYQIEGLYSGLSGVANYLERYIATVTLIAVPIFFLISGVLFFRTFEISILLKKWKKRFFTIMIPYVIWCTIYYLYFAVMSRLPFVSAMMNDNSEVELSFREWFNRIVVDEYYTLWFLKSLIILILLTPLIWLLFKNHSEKFPTGLLALVIMVMAYRYGWIKIGSEIFILLELI